MARIAYLVTREYTDNEDSTPISVSLSLEAAQRAAHAAILAWAADGDTTLLIEQLDKEWTTTDYCPPGKVGEWYRPWTARLPGAPTHELEAWCSVNALPLRD